MQVLFVHGMGRTSMSGWLLLRQLRRAGLKTATFDYVVSCESFARIVERLAARLAPLAAQGGLVLVGHSLGGVLLRAALASMPAQASPARHLFLLGSPIQPSRLAQQLGANLVFRAATRDCGQLLGSPSRMSAIGAVTVPATSIVGTRGIAGLRSAFGDEVNDGVVSLSEVSADWLLDQVHIPVVHTWLPSSRLVASIILDRLGLTPT